MSRIVGVVSSLCQAMDNPRDKVALLSGIADMFRELIVDLHEFADAGMNPSVLSVQPLVCKNRSWL